MLRQGVQGASRWRLRIDSAALRCGLLQTGFTAIELLIAVVVTSVLLTIGVPGFSEFIGRQTLRADANVLQTLLTTARIEAMTSEYGATTVCWNNGDGERLVSSRGGASKNEEPATLSIPAGGIVLVEGSLASSVGFGQTLVSKPLLRAGFVTDNDADNCIGFDAQGLLTEHAFGSAVAEPMRFALCRSAATQRDAIQFELSRSGRLKSKEIKSSGGKQESRPCA